METVRIMRIVSRPVRVIRVMSSAVSGGGGSGSVTSVGLALPNIFTISNSPVTTSGTLTGTFATQTTNKVFAAPNGSTGVPSFRALVSADIPALNYENPLTFSTGLTRSTNTITVNPSQIISTLSNLTTNGFVKTSGGTGALSIDTSTYLTANQTITLSGDISGSGTTTITTTIGNDKVLTANIIDAAVTLAKHANMATASLYYRKTAGTGAPEVNSLATLKTDLLLTGTNSGDVTLAGENYLSISGQIITANAVNLSGTNVTGTLAAGRFPALTGDVTNSAGSLATTIANDAVTTAKILNSNVTLAKLANIADQTILGNNTGGSAAPLALTATQTKVILSLGNVENTALSTWAGTTNITTLGTIGTGVWSGTVINVNKGGTGAATLTGVLFGNGTSAFTAVALPSDASKFLDGTGAFSVPSGGSTGISSATANGAMYATGSTTGTSTGALTDGQLLIGWTSHVPVAATLTGTANQITVTLGNGSITLSIPTSPTFTTPVITGLPTGSGIASAATASTLVSRDSSANINANSLLAGYTTTTTASGTTTLTVASTEQQFFTGSTTQNCKLPVTSTLVLGQSFIIVNNSTGAVTVQSSGANTILILAGGTSVVVTCILTSGTSAASWSYAYLGDIIASGKSLTVSNSLTLAGTDGTVMTFPSTSATIARTDAANTFTGVQTMTSPNFTTPVLGTPFSGNLANCTFPTLNQNTTGSAGTLSPGRTINGTSFDGSANITVTAAAGTLTGTTLNATVVTSSLTSLGTIATGVWQGTLIGSTYGGTGVNNGSATITLANNLVTSGNFSLTFTTTATTNVTLPTSGTLVNTAVTTLSSLVSIGTVTTGTWNATKISEIYGGTNQATYTTGDILYASASNTLSKLAIGSAGQWLKVVSGIPAWATLTALTNPMTTTGDIIYSSDNSGTAARLAVGTTNQILSITSGIPAWQNRNPFHDQVFS